MMGLLLHFWRRLRGLRASNARVIQRSDQLYEQKIILTAATGNYLRDRLYGITPEEGKRDA